LQVVFHDPQLRLLPYPRLRANILLANCDVVARTGWDKLAGTAEWAGAAIAALKAFDTIALSIAGHPHPREAAGALRNIFSSTAST
jgi:hypothetical protein